MDIEGFQIPEIKNIGLKYFITYNAELVDYEIIADLSEIEFVSNGFDRKAEKLMDFGYESMGSTRAKDKERLIIILLDVIDSETHILDLYKKFLEKYEDILSVKEV